MAKTVRGVFRARLTGTHGRMLNMSFKKAAEDLKRELEK
jgi:hypothetical protein